MDTTTQITFTVRRYYDEHIHTWTLIVNGKNVMECMDDEMNAETTNEEAVYWYLHYSQHNHENRK